MPKQTISAPAALGDVRSSSADQRYMGAPFHGTIRQALQQAHSAPEYPIPFVSEAQAAGVNLARYELLKFLRLL